MTHKVAKSKKEKQVTSYGNGFNKVSMWSLTPTERAIVFAALERYVHADTEKTIDNHKAREVKFTFNELMKFVDTPVSADRLEKIVYKVMKADTFFVSGPSKRYLNIFTVADVNKLKRTVTLIVSYEMHMLLVNQQSGYTSLEMTEWMALRSGYSKELYRKLRQYRMTGVYNMPTVELLNYFSIPKNYTASQFRHKILNPCIEELSEYFTNLHVEEVNGAYGYYPSNYIFRFDKHENKVSSIIEIEPEEVMTEEELIEFVLKNTL